MELMRIRDKIVQLRGRAVILDFDLAPLYGCSTRQLRMAVARQEARFPGDFLFQLSSDEWKPLRRQFLTTGLRKKPIPRRPPLAFADGGLIIAAGLLSSPRAVEMSLQLVRAFIALHRQAAGYTGMPQPVKFDDLQLAMQLLIAEEAPAPTAFIGIRKK